jgi:mono/diheme cytochrome c family protein
MFGYLVKGFSVCILLLVGLAACTGEGGRESADTQSQNQKDILSQAELERGIGPITKLELPSTIDTALVSQGQAIFTTKCAACHKLEERYVGPPLGQVLERRSPEFIMNMMLNPDEMAKKHPEGEAMLAQYLTLMPNQNLTESDARSVLEFLRSAQIDSAAAIQ